MYYENNVSLINPHTTKKIILKNIVLLTVFLDFIYIFNLYAIMGEL